jgi:hypothetical protein
LFDAPHHGCYHQIAGWSSLVARWAHNPKVGGSNPPPATNLKYLPFNNISDSLKMACCPNSVRELGRDDKRFHVHRA